MAGGDPHRSQGIVVHHWTVPTEVRSRSSPFVGSRSDSRSCRRLDCREFRTRCFTSRHVTQADCIERAPNSRSRWRRPGHHLRPRRRTSRNTLLRDRHRIDLRCSSTDHPSDGRNARRKRAKSRPSIAFSIGCMTSVNIASSPAHRPENTTLATSAHSATDIAPPRFARTEKDLPAETPTRPGNARGRER